MHRWLAALLAIGCGHDPPAPADARPVAPTLTVDIHVTVGMVVSEPPGIRCGTCQPDQSSGVPCPPGPSTDRTCSFDFDTGTTVSLSLIGENTYTDYVCASEPDMAVKSCSFVITPPLAIGVWGEVPVRPRTDRRVEPGSR